MNKNYHKGLLVTIEGIDGTGKSTLISGLKESLNELNPIFTREPGTAWLGEVVRRGIKEEIDPIAEAFLFAADHAEHIKEVVRPALERGDLVISDRYSDSRYAYQSQTLDGIVPNPMNWLKAMHKDWTIIPDLTFLLVISVDEAMKRIDSERSLKEHFEKKDVLTNVQKNYLLLAEENETGNAGNEPKRFVIIDAQKDKEEILKFVTNIIQNTFREKK